jgi:aspartyl/asparaginyl-tRNA synthetase
MFWVKMIEPELAFADLNDDMACASAYLQYVVGALVYQMLLHTNSANSYFFVQYSDMDALCLFSSRCLHITPFT